MFLIRSAARDIYLHGATLARSPGSEESRAKQNRGKSGAGQQRLREKWAGKGKIRQDREEKGESQDKLSDERRVLF